MENLTCVVDATSLIDKIHEIKEWVYDGYIRLHVPICTFEMVEQLYQSSIVPKEAPKEPPQKRSSYKAVARKEQPLFDINPRIAREFLLRAQSEADDSVTFQLPNEQFTQWKEEEESALKVEQPPEERPTSFAQALLRKLNISDGGDGTNGSKAPAKPRLVARDSAAPKSPWKYHKVPTVSTIGVPVSIKSLLSCVLWRLHEYENNPLMPEAFVLLSNDSETSTIAQRLGIPIKGTSALYQASRTRRNPQDDRDTVGQVEREFAVKRRERPLIEAIVEGPESDIEILISSPNTDIGVGKKVATTGQNEEPNEEIVHENKTSVVDEEQTSSAKEFGGHNNDFNQSEKLQEDERSAKLNGGVKHENSENTKVEPILDYRSSPGTLRDGPSIVVEDQQVSLESSIKGTVHTMANGDKEVTEGHKGHIQPANGQVVGNLSNTAETSENSEDSDDDDEVVVFDPKSRRSSGIPKASTEPPKPVATPISYLKALESGLPRKPMESLKPAATAPQAPRLDLLKPEAYAETSIETPSGKPPTSSGIGAARSPTPTQARQPKRHPGHVQCPPIIASDVPNQTPAQPHFKPPIQVPSQIQRRPSPVPRPQAERQNEATSLLPLENAIQDRGLANLSNEDFTAIQLPVQNVVPSPSQNAHQHKGQYPSQRSTRNGAHRFDQVPAGARRQVHKQPTSQPTVIDPDAFDRSYIIRPRPSTPNGISNGNHRVPSPRMNPRRAAATSEPDVEFVLKSGAPRAATRGRGKLWVP